MDQTLLVTGATGTVGTSVVSSLLDYPVHIKAAFHQNPVALAHPNISSVRFDLKDPSTYVDALKNVTGLFLLPPASREGYALAIQFIKSLVEVAPDLRHIVSISGMGTTPNDGSYYGEMEGLIQTTGIPYSLLRPNWFMQNFHTYFIDGIRYGELALPAGEAVTTFVDARDIGAVAAKILAEESFQWEALTLTGWDMLTYREAVNMINKITGLKITYRPINDHAMRKGLEEAGWNQAGVEEMLELFGQVRNGLNATMTQDVTKVLGKAPRTFEKYVQDHKSLLI